MASPPYPIYKRPKLRPKKQKLPASIWFGSGAMFFFLLSFRLGEKKQNRNVPRPIVISWLWWKENAVVFRVVVYTYVTYDRSRGRRASGTSLPWRSWVSLPYQMTGTRVMAFRMLVHTYHGGEDGGRRGEGYQTLWPLACLVINSPPSYLSKSNAFVTSDFNHAHTLKHPHYYGHFHATKLVKKYSSYVLQETKFFASHEFVAKWARIPYFSRC